MKKPTRILIWMFLFLLLVATAGGLFYDALHTAFLANELFNSMILAVFALGVLINFRQVLSLGTEIRWLEAFRRGEPDSVRQPTMLASMARMLTGRSHKDFSLSAVSLRTLMDGIRSRMEESRDLSRYVIGLLVFLGLLGTFWGLLATLRSVGQVIDGLAVGGDDISGLFDELKAGLQGPLYGMGTAFSSSLFGLAGSLILGFLDLQAGHAQNRFSNELEEWLSGLTRLSSGHLFGEGEQPAASYTQALLEQTAENLDKLQRALAHSEEERRSTQHQMQALATQITALTEQIQHEQKLLLNMAKRQSELQPVLTTLADGAAHAWGINQESQQHLRNLDLGINRLADELKAGRAQGLEELRKEMRLLSRTLAQLPYKTSGDTDSGTPIR